ncbi:MAG: L-aspartate oxidase [SAR324 cluster bacterium]|nr:L-aspartate oxidase [SAR324 cluster bacterium]
MKLKTPLVVIGSGLAGLLSARLAADHMPVILLTKNTIFDSNTQWSQGGIAAVCGKNDSVELHIRDTMIAGSGHCDQQAVQVLSKASFKAIQTLEQLGIRFDRDEDNNYALGMEGSHSVKRILHAGGDATGAEIQRGLVQSVEQHPNIEIREHTLVTRILRNRERVQGVLYYDVTTRKMAEIHTPQVVLATGGAGQLFEYTSNPDGATGDGVILAYCCGAQLMDLEFYQFHPTALNLPGRPNFLITEALRGEGAVLRNSRGNAFMHDAHPLRDLAPRDVVSRVIYQQMSQEKQQIFLDATEIAETIALEKRFPTIFKTCLHFGIDIRVQKIPVTPVAHYMMGGVYTDLWGRTTVPGLYACGEVTRTGVHGANRLASNSLLEAAVFAMRVVGSLKKDQRQKSLSEPSGYLQPRYSKTPTLISLPDLKKMMWDKVGLSRRAESLKMVCDCLHDASLPNPEPSGKAVFELETLQLMARLMAEAALEREESCGAHYREDFPKQHTPRRPPIIKMIYDWAS